MLRFLLLFPLVSLLLVGCGSRAPRAAGNAERPNIIFLLTDDQRQDLMGFAGNPIVQTPHMDRLAREGVYFNNSYVTTAICSVSRASILSGQYGRRHNLWWFGRPFSDTAFARTYPMRLRAAGYRVGFIGKYGVDSPDPATAFDYWGGFGGQGSYHQKDSLGNYLHLTRKIGRQMSKFLDRFGDGPAPFQLSVSFKAPHVQGGEQTPDRIFPADSAYAAYYEGLDWPRPPQWDDRADYDERFRRGNEATKRFERRFATPERYRASLEGYYRLVHGVDVVIGELLAELESRGLADNTVIVFASDNGFYLGEYGFGGKWFAHEPSIRVPLFIYDPRPGARGGRRYDAVALNIDIAPTILDLAGLPPSPGMQGRSLRPFLSGRVPADWREDFLYEHLMPGPEEVPYYIPSTEGVVSPRAKYSEYFVGWTNDTTLTRERYDLRRDPDERHNLLGRDPGADARARRRMLDLIDRAR